MCRICRFSIGGVAIWCSAARGHCFGTRPIGDVVRRFGQHSGLHCLSEDDEGGGLDDRRTESRRGETTR